MREMLFEMSIKSWKKARGLKDCCSFFAVFALLFLAVFAVKGFFNAKRAKI
jgi:hypothetical protein